MTPIKSDFAAFLAKLSLNPAYEKREDPSIKSVADSIDSIAAAFETFKASNDVTALRATVEKLETKLARPGALSTAATTDAAPGLKFTVNGKETPALRTPSEIRSYFDTRGDGAPDIKITDFMRSVANLGGSPEARATLSVGTDADGGYMVPTKLMGGVLSAMVAGSSVVSAGGSIVPLENLDAKSFRIAAVDTIPTASWRAENGSVAESSPGFRAIEIVPRSLAFFFKVSREWLADASGTDQVLQMVIGQAFGKELDRVALRGSGTAPEPRGILNTSGIIAVTNGANGASLATTKYANLWTGVQQMLEANADMPTAAIMSPRSGVVLGGLADTTGQPLQTPRMLADQEWLVTSQIPNNLTVGTSSDCSEIYMGDFSKLVYAMRERMSIQVLNEAFATNGQIAFVCHVRADVALLYPKAFAVATGVRP